MVKLGKGQITVLIATSLPMAAVGAAGAVATYVNMDNVLHRSASALGLVAAGEGATLICALIALAVTLMGQHTPVFVRLGMWVIPLVASATGVALAPNNTERVVMGVTPLAMTAAGEGIAFVARRIVAYRTGTDLEQQRRSGLLLWHANRAANSTGMAQKISTAAVWRLTKRFAATDPQMAVQLAETQRFHIAEGASQNLAAVLTRAAESAPKALPAAPAAQTPAGPYEGAYGPLGIAEDGISLYPTDRADGLVDIDGEPYEMVTLDEQAEDLAPWIQEVLDEGAANIYADPLVKLLTVDEVAKRKGVKPGTVRSWKHRGKLRVYDTVDGSPRFHPMDVDALD